MRKKLFTFLLALVTSVGLMNAAVDDSGSCGANVTYSFNGATGEMTITGTGPMTDFASASNAPWYSYKNDITSVTITDGVTSVGSYSFGYYGNLVTVTIGNDVETIGYYAFGDCYKFTTLNLGNSVKHIGDRAFMWAKVLTGFTLPSTLETIGERAFLQNKVITSLTIPSNVTSIGESAFMYCAALTSITVEATTPPTLDATVFEGVPTTIPLNVPNGSVDAYEAAAQWTEFDIQGYGPAPAPASSVTAARFVYNYDCQRNPAYPKKETACTLSGFKDPLEGYKGTRNGNIALGPWKLEFVAYYTPSNNYGCASQVNTAVYQYYSNLSSQEREAKKLEMPIFRLWQYNLAAQEFQPAAYGVVCAYASEGNIEDHGALFISSNSYGCFLSGHQHTTSFALTCENDLTTGLTALVDAASAPSDPYYDVVWPVIVSIDAIGSVELSEHCKYYIEGSRAAYDALTDEQKAQVTNYSTLTDAETQWAALAALAQPYADAVIDLINAIPNPVVYTQDCKDKIDAAQDAYDALTDGQKVLVTNAETLLQAPIAFINVAHPNILFTADNDNIKRIEDVTLPKSFTAGYFSTDNEFLGILKELYGINEDAYINFIYSNNDAVTRSGNNLTVNPFSGTATVVGSLVIMSTSTDSPYSVNITLELPPFGPAPTPTPSGDKLSGVFSISGTKAVNFSKGNLQYDSDTQGWQFAANQWDYIGNAAGNNAITSNGIADNNGIVDMFCWVGASSSLEGIKQYGIISSFSGYGSVAGEALKSDWGNIMGGDWRTLSKDEWIYLLTERTNAANLRTLGTVNGKAGLILMPDGWTASGVALTVTTANYTTNDINTTNWATLEGQGCAFLPAAGCRALGSFDGVGGDGSYWSSTSRASGATFAHRLHFRATDVDPTDFVDRFNGMSVRLVSETTPTPAPTPTDEQVPTNADPENPSYHYSTFFHSTQNYKLSNDGTQAFIADLSNNELVLTEIAHGEQVIPANTAVILRKTGSADPVVLTPTAENGVSVNPDDNSLEGVDVATPVADIAGLTTTNCYVLSGTNEHGVGFYKINDTMLKAHKAYVKYAGSSNNAPKKMRFVYGQATGIEDVQGNNVQSTKVIENGVLYIIRDGKTYNAMGQVVK